MKRSPTIWRYDYLYCTDRMQEKDAYPMFFIGTRDEWNEYVKNEVGLWGACPFSVTRRHATSQEVETYLTMKEDFNYTSPYES